MKADQVRARTRHQRCEPLHEFQRRLGEAREVHLARLLQLFQRVNGRGLNNATDDWTVKAIFSFSFF